MIPIGFNSRSVISFPAKHSGWNPQNIKLTAEATGEAGIFQEMAVSAFVDNDRIADVLVGLDEAGELRVLITANGEGDGDKRVAVYPQRPENKSVEHFGE